MQRCEACEGTRGVVPFGGRLLQVLEGHARYSRSGTRGRLYNKALQKQVVVVI